MAFVNLENTELKKAVATPAEGQHYSNMMSEVNAYRQTDSTQISLYSYFRASSTPRPNIRNEWAQTELDFGNSENLYRQSQADPHPFTPAEIAGAGPNEAVMLNEYEAVRKGPYASVAYDRNAPKMPNGFGLVNPGFQLDQVARSDSPRQVLDNVSANWSQSGSAGVDQGPLPDCTFESSLASLASTPKGQEDISKMISKNKDGSYEVTFPGDPSKPVDITSKDLADPRIQDSAGWAKILEAANIKLHPNLAEPHKGRTKGAMQLLTGHNAEEILPGDAPRTAANVYSEEQWIHSRLSQGDTVVAEWAPGHGPAEDNHAYSVLQESNGEVTVRNPWGVQFADGVNRPRVGGTIDGVTNIGGGELEMSMQTFNREFNRVCADKP